jgi:hypothetical protein
MHASKHGLQSWMKRRALPRQKQHIGKLIESYRAGLTACKGGVQGVTEDEAALIENAARAYGACLLIFEEGAQKGLVREVDGTWDLTPGFSRLIGFLSAERAALLGLGVGRRQKDVKDLHTLLTEAANDGEEDNGR